MAVTDVATSEARARAARARLVADLVVLRDRLSPVSIAGRVASGIKSKGGEVIEEGVEAVREHRWAVAGVATLAGLLLARRPITAMLRGDETPAPPAGLSEDSQENSR